MKIELKRDDPALKDIIVEMKSGHYINQSQWGYATNVSVKDLVEFYEKWLEVAIRVKTFASMKESVKNLLKDIEDLDAYGGKDTDED